MLLNRLLSAVASVFLGACTRSENRKIVNPMMIISSAVASSWWENKTKEGKRNCPYKDRVKHGEHLCTKIDVTHPPQSLTSVLNQEWQLGCFAPPSFRPSISLKKQLQPTVILGQVLSKLCLPFSDSEGDCAETSVELTISLYTGIGHTTHRQQFLLFNNYP